jgi:hypothetical protein
VRRLAALAALALASSACAGDARPSRAEYVEKADATCRKYEQKLEPLGRELATAKGAGDVAGTIDRALPVVREGVAELRELEPPAGLEREANRWLRSNDRSVEKLEELREAAKENDLREFRRLAQAAKANEERAADRARALGLRDCAQDEAVSGL